MNELMQIQHDKDVLNDNELYEPNTPKKHKMASYKNNQDMPGPNLEPMSLNWDKIYGKWNEELFRLFIANCEENSDGNEIGTDEDKYNIHKMFMDCLHCIKNLIQQSQPKDNENQEHYVARLKLRKESDIFKQNAKNTNGKHQRHHSRHGEVSGNHDFTG